MSAWNLQLRNSSYTTDNVEILIRQLKAYCSDKLDIGRLCLGREGKENYLELNIARRVETDVGVWKKLTEDTVNESSEMMKDIVSMMAFSMVGALATMIVSTVTIILAAIVDLAPFLGMILAVRTSIFKIRPECIM